MEELGVAVNVRSFADTSLEQWNKELTAGNQRLENVKTKCEYSRMTACPHFFLYW